MWLLAVLCMLPPAVSDLRYRAASLDSCIAVLLVGLGVFTMWVLSAPIHDVMTAATVTGAAAAVSWAGGRWLGGGDGDWWFVAGSCAALSTVDVAAPMLAVSVACVSAALVHVVMCVSRPGLPFPRRLYQHVKRRGDVFCVDVASGEMLAAGDSGMTARPALPFVTFLAAASLAAGVLLSP